METYHTKCCQDALFAMRSIRPMGSIRFMKPMNSIRLLKDVYNARHEIIKLKIL